MDSVTASYYVMLLVAKALLINKGIRPKTHRGIMHLFSKEFIKDGDFDPILGKKFLRTQSLREKADYEIIVDIDERIAKEKLNQCKLFIKEAEKFI
ncbi:MAG: HEPN domain-containing protein [Methanobacteriaceae archaeon]|nr:HEPN domain-containing protein [Methanobacteriaceae archaeon]